jgi:hypothetical protein
MRDRQRLLQHPEERRGYLLLGVVQARLGDLQVPVTQLRPEEAVQLERGVGEVVGGKRATDALDRALETREDPAILGTGRARFRLDLGRTRQHQP